MMLRTGMLVALVAGGLVVPSQAEQNVAPEGFVALFNGADLAGWWGWGTKHYKHYADLDAEALAKLQEESRTNIRQHWRVEDGELTNDGHGLYLTTNKFYGDFELLVDYKTVPKADSGIYLRGIPQVQIWDVTEEGGSWRFGSAKGSGGLWNNAPGSKGKDPLVLADRPFGQWNSFRITMIGDVVTVYLNDQLVVDQARLRNFFEKQSPVPATGPIQLQTHGGEIRWRNIFLRELKTAPETTANK